MGLKKVFLLFLPLILLTGLSPVSAQTNPDPFLPADAPQLIESGDAEELLELKGRLRQIESMLLAQKDRENELLRDLNKMMISGQEEPEDTSADDARKELDAVQFKFQAESASLEAKIQQLQIALVAGQERDLRMTQEMNKTILITVSTVAGMGLLVFMVTVFLQYRLMSRPVQQVYMPTPALAIEAGPGQLPVREEKETQEPETGLVENTKVEETNERFVSAIERLEARIMHMEEGLSHADDVLNSVPDLEMDEPTVDLGSDILDGGEVISDEFVSEKMGYKEIPVGLDALDAEFMEELSKEPDEMDVAVLEEEGKRFLQKEDWALAFKYYDQLVILDRQRVENWVNRGRALEMLDREEEAIESYNYAIEANPDLPSPFLYKAALLSRMERYEEAQKFYNAALSKVPVQKAEPAAVLG